MSDQTVSCYSSRLLIDYALSKGVDFSSFLLYLHTPYKDLVNNRKWMSVFDWVKLVKFVSGSVNMSIDQIGYDIVMGTAYNPTFRLLLLQIFPIYLMRKMRITNTLFSNYVNRNQYAVLDAPTANSVTLRLFIKDKSLHAKELCIYNKGVAKAILELRGHRGVEVEDLTCVSTDVACDCCTYRMSWVSCNKEKGAALAIKLHRKLKKDQEAEDLPACILSDEELAVLFSAKDQGVAIVKK